MNEFPRVRTLDSGLMGIYFRMLRECKRDEKIVTINGILTRTKKTKLDNIMERICK